MDDEFLMAEVERRQFGEPGVTFVKAVALSWTETGGHRRSAFFLGGNHACSELGRRDGRIDSRPVIAGRNGSVVHGAERLREGVFCWPHETRT